MSNSAQALARIKEVVAKEQKYAPSAFACKLGLWHFGLSKEDVESVMRDYDIAEHRIEAFDGKKVTLVLV